MQPTENPSPFIKFEEFQDFTNNLDLKKYLKPKEFHGTNPSIYQLADTEGIVNDFVAFLGTQDKNADLVTAIVNSDPSSDTQAMMKNQAEWDLLPRYVLRQKLEDEFGSEININNAIEGLCEDIATKLALEGLKYLKMQNALEYVKENQDKIFEDKETADKVMFIINKTIHLDFEV